MNTSISYNKTALYLFCLLTTFSFTYFVSGDVDQGSIFEDFDSDGLSNSEEQIYGTDPHDADTDRDGYNDGVEITSGYDPLVPAPGDRIINQEQLGQRHSVLGRGGLEGSLTGDFMSGFGDYAAQLQSAGLNFSDEEINQQVQSLITPESTELYVDAVNMDRITIKEQNYEELSQTEREQREVNDYEEYEAAILYIYKETYSDSFSSDQPNDVVAEFLGRAQVLQQGGDQFSYFFDLAEKGVSSTDQLYAVAVPEDLLSLHVKSLEISHYIDAIHQSQKGINLEEDPINFILGVTRMQGVVQMMQELRDEWYQTRFDYLGERSPGSLVDSLVDDFDSSL